MKFKYFRDPENFASKLKEESDCSVCNSLGKWFNAGGYPGLTYIDSVCDQCLKDGKLEEIEVEANQAIDGTSEQRDTIIYRTPALPHGRTARGPLLKVIIVSLKKLLQKPTLMINLISLNHSFHTTRIAPI